MSNIFDLLLISHSGKTNVDNVIVQYNNFMVYPSLNLKYSVCVNLHIHDSRRNHFIISHNINKFICHFNK